MKPIEIKTQSDAKLDVQLSKVTITDSEGKRGAPNEIVLTSTTLSNLNEVDNEVISFISLSIDEAGYLSDILKALVNKANKEEKPKIQISTISDMEIEINKVDSTVTGVIQKADY